MNELGIQHEGPETMFSRRMRKASHKRICTQEGNALDTIAFVCLVRLFMRGSNFLLLLEICQSFQIFRPLLEAVLAAAYIPRHGLSQLQPKTFTNIPPLSHAYTHVCTHSFENQQPSGCVLPPVPTAPDFCISFYTHRFLTHFTRFT